ncbi:MAG TPA: flagellar biosynthetic protein FliP, partial [Cellvibrio sp.]
MSSARRLLTGIALLASLLLSPLSAWAAGGDIPLLQFNDTAGGGQEMSVKLQILVLMTLLGFLPAMLMMMTCFTRFIIVLAILRQAIGLQQSPPNPVLIGVALCLTLLVMRPVGQEIYTKAYVPFEADQITLQQGLTEAKHTLSRFML